jgi:hypothetical protein
MKALFRPHDPLKTAKFEEYPCEVRATKGDKVFIEYYKPLDGNRRVWVSARKVHDAPMTFGFKKRDRSKE